MRIQKPPISRQIGSVREVYTKYSNGTSPPPPSTTESTTYNHYYTRTITLLFLSSLTADTYTTWLNDKPKGKLDLQVLELKFIVRLIEVLAQTCSFYLTVMILSVLLLGIRDVKNMLLSLIISSFAKLFAIPSAIWSRNTNLLILSYIFVLANNMVIIRVMSDRKVGSCLVVMAGFLVERYIDFTLSQNVFPWDNISVYKLLFNGTSTAGKLNHSGLNRNIYWEGN